MDVIFVFGSVIIFGLLVNFIYRRIFKFYYKIDPVDLIDDKKDIKKKNEIKIMMRLKIIILWKVTFMVLYNVNIKKIIASKG